MCSNLFRVTQAKLAIFLHPCKQFSKKMQKRAGKPRARDISAPPRAQLKLRSRRRKSAPAQRRATPHGPSARLEGQGAQQLGFRLATGPTASAGRALPRRSASADPEASLAATATEPHRGGRFAAPSIGSAWRPAVGGLAAQRAAGRAHSGTGRGRLVGKAGRMQFNIILIIRNLVLGANSFKNLWRGRRFRIFSLYLRSNCFLL